MTLLQNRYLLGEELGRGAFGKTYLATDTHSPSNRKCVVKELIWSGDPEMADQVRERFRREAILLESLGRDSQGAFPNCMRTSARTSAITWFRNGLTVRPSRKS